MKKEKKPISTQERERALIIRENNLFKKIRVFQEEKEEFYRMRSFLSNLDKEHHQTATAILSIITILIAILYTYNSYLAFKDNQYIIFGIQVIVCLISVFSLLTTLVYLKKNR